jgi:hypothetical protein
VTDKMQGFEDGRPLRGHAEAALAQGLGVAGDTGYLSFLIGNIINKDPVQERKYVYAVNGRFRIGSGAS